MKNYQIIFSPTGGTEKIANAITQNWSHVDTSDLSVPDTGFQVIAAISAVSEHSIIHEFAAERPDLDDCKVLAKFGEQVLEKASSNDFSKPSIPGNRPYKKAGSGMIPKTGSACISCMRCVSICIRAHPAWKAFYDKK